MPRTSSSRPEYHAFAALYPAIGSAVQGSGPTAGDALAEAERGLGSAAGLETYRVGPRLAAVLALGTYDPATPLVIERGLDLPEPRVELHLADERAEALADLRAAYALARGLWAGRDWGDADRVCPETNDRGIVRLFRTSDRLDVTAWGIPDGADGQPWRDAVAVAREALRLGLERDDEVAVEEACRALRALAAASDLEVKARAAEAEAAALEALRAAEAGDAAGAVEAADRAAATERAFGDDPTWGALRGAARRFAEICAEE